MTRTFAALIVLAAAARSATGQSSTASVEPAIARARQRAASGDSAAGRVILDSLMAAKFENVVSRGEVTYWIARLAATTSQREHDLTAFIIDYPFSPRAGAAQFELGMLELAHGDRERAATHLAGFLAASPGDSNRATASLALAKILFDRGEVSRACAVVLSGRAELPANVIELRNQFEFAAGPCRGVDTSVVVPRPPRPPQPETTSTPRPEFGEYTVQAAAFDLRNQADRFATRLRGRGLEARVVGKKKPFRVRVGHYTTHAQAEVVSRKIEALTKSKPFVLLIGPEEK